MPYLIRVRLPDLPGALGRLAHALGEINADIESVAVVDRVDGAAVDDLIVALPAGALADSVVTAVSGVEGAVLETIRPHPGRARLDDELALLDVAATSDDPVKVLVRGLPDLLAAQYAIAVDGGATTGIIATSPSAPESAIRLDWLPVAAPGEIMAVDVFAEPSTAGPDCELVVAPLGATAAVVLARNGGAAFRPAEVMRLAHLVNVVQIARANGERDAGS